MNESRVAVSLGNGWKKAPLLNYSWTGTPGELTTPTSIDKFKSPESYLVFKSYFNSMVNKLSFQSAVKYASFLFVTGEFPNSCSQSVPDKPSIHLPLLSQYHSPVIYSIPAQSHYVKCCDLSQLLFLPNETKNAQLFCFCLPTSHPVYIFFLFPTFK